MVGFWVQVGHVGLACVSLAWALGGGVKRGGCFHAPAACNNRVKVCPVILTSFKSLMGRNGDTAPLPAPFPSLIIRAEWADLSRARRAGSEWWEDVFWFNGLYTTMGPPGLLASILLDGRQRVAPRFPPETLPGAPALHPSQVPGQGDTRGQRGHGLEAQPSLCALQQASWGSCPWTLGHLPVPCSLLLATTPAVFALPTDQAASIQPKAMPAGCQGCTWRPPPAAAGTPRGSALFPSPPWVPVSAPGGSGSPLAGGPLGFAGSHKGRVFLAFHSLLLWAVCGIYLSLKYL